MLALLFNTALSQYTHHAHATSLGDTITVFVKCTKPLDGRALAESMKFPQNMYICCMMDITQSKFLMFTYHAPVCKL